MASISGGSSVNGVSVFDFAEVLIGFESQSLRILLACHRSFWVVFGSLWMVPVCTPFPSNSCVHVELNGHHYSWIFLCLLILVYFYDVSLVYC